MLHIVSKCKNDLTYAHTHTQAHACTSVNIDADTHIKGHPPPTHTHKGIRRSPNYISQHGTFFKSNRSHMIMKFYIQLTCQDHKFQPSFQAMDTLATFSVSCACSSDQDQ